MYRKTELQPVNKRQKAETAKKECKTNRENYTKLIYIFKIFFGKSKVQS